MKRLLLFLTKSQCRTYTIPFFIFIYFLFIHNSFAQSPIEGNFDIDAFIQDLFQQQDKNINYEDFYESLFQFYTNPLDLNLATREDLQSLYFLSEIQIKSFFQYKISTGDILSTYELQVIPGFDPLTISKLLPFIEVRNKMMLPKNLWGEITREKNSYLLLRYSNRLENKHEKINSPSSNYGGASDNLYMRFRSSHSKDYSIGFTVEKDAGEKNTWSPSTKRYGADFYSCHFTLFNKGKFKAITLGDYQLQFGQGLVLSSGFSIGKGAETISTTRRSNIGVRSYTSVLESGFFRGGAVTYSIHKNFDITGFYSHTNMDAKINTDTLYEDQFITSIQNSGYHRTPQEIAAKHQINQQATGGNVSYRNNHNDLHLGLSLVNSHYQIALKKSSAVYNQFAFEGKNNFNTSIDYSYVKNNFNLFGEAAISQNGGKAILAGVISSLSSHAEFAMVYRNYEKKFQSIYGNAFGENTNNNNEKGVYWGIKIKPFVKWTLSAYYDRFSFPWLKYHVDAPSNGYEYLVRINYQPTKFILLYMQARTENKEKNQTNDLISIDCISPSIKKNFMINLDYKAQKHISLKSRVQLSSYRQTNSITYGYFIMEEIDLDLRKVKLSARYALFDTDDYDNRQYAFEKDVLYSFSIPVLYGKGSRIYLMGRFKIMRNMDMWIKYSKTKYFGTSINVIDPINSDIKMEIRYVF
jgi:hypothetical protein